MLQQLFFTAPHSIPAFSPLQRETLAAHLSRAFSEATKEKTIFFKLPTMEEASSPIEGDVAAFPPSYLVLTLTFSSSVSGGFSKIHNSSDRIRAKSVPTVSRDNGIFSTEKAEKFMAIPDASHGIVIDYQHLSPPAGLTPTMPSPRCDQDDAHMNHNEEDTTPLELHKLKEQLKLLQERVDQQIQEIYRLRNNASP